MYKNTENFLAFATQYCVGESYWDAFALLSERLDGANLVGQLFDFCTLFCILVLRENKTKQSMLSNLQVEILKTFSRPLPETQLMEIKQLLANYFAQKVDSDIDKLFEENNWDAKSKVDEWLGEHLRTPYTSPK